MRLLLSMALVVAGVLALGERGAVLIGFALMGAGFWLYERRPVRAGEERLVGAVFALAALGAVLTLAAFGLQLLLRTLP